MRLAWKDFAQRRKLNLGMFKSMTYTDYTSWCDLRGVEPVSENSFIGAKNILSTPALEQDVPDVEEVLADIVTISVKEYDEKQIKKLKKPSLIKLCKEENIALKGNETKSVLVSLLLSLNNQ